MALSRWEQWKKKKENCINLMQNIYLYVGFFTALDMKSSEHRLFLPLCFYRIRVMRSPFLTEAIGIYTLH